MLSVCPDIVDYEREYTHILKPDKTAFVLNKLVLMVIRIILCKTHFIYRLLKFIPNNLMC